MAVFNMHSAVLYTLKRNWDVTWFHLSQICILCGSAFLLVPRFKGFGYGLSELVALLSYAVIHIQVAALFRPSYSRAMPWIVVFTPPLFAPLVPASWIIPLWLPFVAIFLMEEPRGQVARYIGYLRKGITKA